MTDIVERLRSAALPGTNRNVIDCAAADEIERLRLDAARYRWLRDSASIRTVHIGTPDRWSYFGSAADAAIDAAMKG